MNHQAKRTGTSLGMEGRLLPARYGYCAVVEQFLSASECQALRARAEQVGFRGAIADYPPSYRDNCRLAVDDHELAARLFSRLSPHAPRTLEHRADAGKGERWQLASLNPRLRFCRYRAGQQFQMHQDGVYFAPDQQQSLLTFMVYLTDGAHFEGGDTLFYASEPGQRGAARVIARVRPRLGMLILFDHALWHAGEAVREGQKYILRSDVIYRRAPGAETEAAAPKQPFSGHRGYVWALEKLPKQRLASAGRDTSIRLWDYAGVSRGELRGHTQSVLGLAVYGDERLASVSRDRTLKLWDLANARCLRSVVAHDAAVLSVLAVGHPRVREASRPAPPMGVTTLLTGAADALLKLWDSDACQLATLSGHTGWVWSLTRVDAGSIASASEDGTVRLWDLARLTCRTVLPGRVPLRTLACSGDARLLVTGDRDGYLSVWSDLTERPRLVLRFAAHSAAVRRVRFMDDQTLVSAGEDRQVRSWRVTDGVLLGQHAHDNFVSDVLPIGPDRYVSCSYDSTIASHQRRGHGH